MDNYKLICILGYVFAALGAIVATSLEFGWIQTKPPVELYWAYLIGGLITLKCSYGWYMKNE
jgi:H+/Cl- antiporter ClcA